MNFSVSERKSWIERLKNENFELLIIGGGVTGAGALLDAQSRGIKTCLIESQGTSSRSTKLIHGGLRYLKQGDLKLVAEVGKERNILYKNAPHLTQPTEVIIPFVEKGSMGKFSSKLAMLTYEFLAKVESRFKHKLLNKRELMNLVPSFKNDKLKGGVIYFEYKTNDSRLVIENIKKALEYDALALNYVKATGFLYQNSKISGVNVEDLLSGEQFEIKTQTCISAVGPWTDQIMQLDNAQAPNKVILTKGVHLTLDKKDFPLENAVYYEVGDGRMVFAIPKFENVYIGTTDTFYTEDKANPAVEKKDIDYILNSIKNNFNNTQKLTNQSIKGAWAGLRPLVKEEGKGETEISRKDEIFETDSNLIAIAGGKLTGYRKMAEKVVDIADKKLSEINHSTKRYCITEDMKFLGYDPNPEKEFIEMAENQGISTAHAEELYHWFGKQAYQVIGYPTIENIPNYLAKSLGYCFDNEFVINPIDFLIHRTQVAYFDLELSKKVLPFVYGYLKNKSIIEMKEISFYEKQLTFLEEFKL
jgi:glycerol-3-phosphate dehydrogenase